MRVDLGMFLTEIFVMFYIISNLTRFLIELILWYSAKIARMEDEEQARLIEEEERRERQARLRKQQKRR